MAKPLTDDEREHIVALIHQGHSANEIARQTQRSADTVSRIARSIGWRFGHTNLAHAHEARSAYTAERRASIAARLTEEVEQILIDLHRPHLAFNFGGKDNTYEEHLLDEPPVDAKRAMVQSISTLMRTVLDIDRHDNRADSGASAVDDWLRSIVGSA